MSEYNHTVDTKGRLIVPAKYREELGISFIVTKGIDTCLYVYAKDEWQHVMDSLNALRMTSKEARSFTRFLIGGATEVEVDGQGRILLPQYLREYAELTKDTVLVGMGKRIEIWDKERYNSELDNTDVEQLSEKLDEMGIWI